MSSSRLRRPLLAVILPVLALLAIATPVQAAGTPDISVSAGDPQEILYGDQATVTLTAANPAGQPRGYNLSLRAELPVGVTFVPGSGPAGIQATVIANQPAAGRQTVIFSNVSDLSANSTYAVSFKVAHNPAQQAVGSTFTVNAGAYVNSDARHVPTFDAAGQPVISSYTGSATTTHPVKLLPFRVIREAPDNQLRGAHDFQYATRVTIENNKVGATNGFTLTDYVPAGVEVLACGSGDNTGSDEYPASGPLNPGNAPTLSGCVPPSSVETVNVDPDGAGPLASGVYTRQTWDNLGNLAASGTLVLEFATAIPIRENRETFSGVTPTPESAEQASNLRNNSGDETYDEQPLRSFAQAGGTYAGTTHQASDDQTTIAEDLILSKEASSDAIAVGATTTWTLTARASEYRWVDDTVIVDTVPDGLCVLGAVDYDPTGSECGPVIGADPYGNVVENADGSWTVTFDPLPRIAPGGSQSVVLTTQTRSHYQEGGADAGEVLANDTWTNVADVSGDDWVICTGGGSYSDCAGGTKIDHDETDGEPDVDGAWARQVAASPELYKQVASSGSAGDCLTATYQNGTAAGYGPGDRVCWKVRMEFPGGTPTGGVELTDFLPIGHAYVGGSFAQTGANNINWAIDDTLAADGVLTFDLGTAQVADESAVFEGVLATTIETQASPAFPGQLTQNLLKASSTNTPTTSFPLRADAGATMEAPVVALDKSVVDVDGAAPSGTPPNVLPNDVVTYRVRLTNSGARDAHDVEVWDDLPAGITCAMISSFGSATCDPVTDTVQWTVPTVAAGPGGVNLEYDVTIPSTGSGQLYTNSAGVRYYESDTNVGTQVPYYPESNIDPTVPAGDQNAAAAEDTQSVRTALIAVAKARGTEVTAETGNGNTVATIGELVNYTVTFTVPDDTVLYGNAQLNDPLTRHTLVPGSIAAQMNGGGLPAGVTVAQNGNGVRLSFPTDYVATADEAYTVTFTAQVDDTYNGNRRGGPALSNTATLTYQTSSGGATQTRNSPAVTTAIVEPNLEATKVSGDADGIVEPGEEVRFTVGAANVAGTNVSTAHQVSLVDTVPAGITPLVAQGGATVADGGTVGPGGGVWNATARTITWPTIATIAPGSAEERDYYARVDDPATSQARLVNSVRVAGSSLGAGQEAGGERTDATTAPGYADTATATLDIIGMDIAKTMTPAQQTVGGVVTGTLTVTVPASIGVIDAFVTDVLPDGLVFDEYVSATCVSGCAGAPIAPTTLPEEDAGGGQTRLGWWIGDQPFHTEPRVLELVYRAYVESDRDAGDTLTNSATWHLNRTEQITDAPAAIPGGSDVTSDPVTDTTTVTEPAIAIDKTVSGDADADDARAAQPGDTFTYSIVVENTGDHAAYDVDVTDQPAGEIVNVVPTAGSGFVTDGWTAGDTDLAWTIPGPIAAGASVTLSYTAALAPSANLAPGAVANTADVPSFWGVGEEERTDNGFAYREYTHVTDDTVTLTLDTPQVAVAKAATGGASAHVGTPYAWTITATNTAANATAHGVDVTDTLPRNWTYDPGSATVDGTPVEPAVTSDPAGDELRWTDVANLVAGEDVVIVLTATPKLVAALDPGFGPGIPHENTAVVSGVADGSGATGDLDGSYSPGPDTAQTILLVPDADLGVEKTTTTAPVAGGTVAWRVVVTNHGPDGSPAAALTDTVPAGVTVTAATTTQGTCDITGAPTVTCAFGELENGDSVTVDITGTVADAASAGATLANTATASDPAINDTVPGNDTDSTSDPVLGRAALSLDKERLDPLVPSRSARWRLTLANAGPSVAQDAEIVDTLPAGLTFESAPGCTEAAGVVTCPVGDLAPGGTATVEITTTVDATAGTLRNAAVAGSPTPALDGGPNEVDAEADGPVVQPDLAITEFVEGKPVTGGTLTHGFVVTNAGGAATYGPTTVTMTYPAGLVPQTASGSGWACRVAGQTVTCTRPDSLGSAAGFPAIYVRSRVTAAAGTPLVVRSHVSTPGDTDAGNDNAQAVVLAEAVATAPEAPSCAGGGQLFVAQSRLWAGARARVRGHVASAGGQVVAGQLVRLQPKGGKARTVRTDARGRYAFAVHPASRAVRYTVSVPGCGMSKPVRTRRADSCRSLSVGRASLQAGDAARLRIRMRAGGLPLAGVQVKLSGAGVKKVARTNRSGRVNVRVRPDRAGIISVAARSAVRCTRRVGVVAQDTAAQLTG